MSPHNVESAQVVLPCSEPISTTINFFTGIGFKVRTIVPADHPRMAVLQGFGLTLRLEVPRRAFGEGRAGMNYRDLIPGRLGGRFIASHILIPHGGPVADYVHFHNIRFQMIYCYRGWVKVAYEDQGEPMLLQEGDYQLAPGGTRHDLVSTDTGALIYAHGDMEMKFTGA